MTFAQLEIGDKFRTVGVITRELGQRVFEKKLDQIEGAENIPTNAVLNKGKDRGESFHYFPAHTEVNKED